IEDKDRRLQMGAEGRKRAISNYDWRVIIRAYEDMWEEQAKKRKGKAFDGTPAGWQAVHPGFPDPSAMFQGFPTSHISIDHRLELTGGNDDVARTARHRMNIFGMDMLLPDSVISALLGLVYAQPKIQVFEVKNALNIEDDDRLMRTIAWLMKM